MIAPKPTHRPRKISLWRHFRLFSKDILSAQPEHLYRAKMAEFKTPFFASVLLNEPSLIAEVLKERPQDFPKSNRIAAGLYPLLGRESVFVTNGKTWARQRRIIDPAFEGGKLRARFGAMYDAVTEARDAVTTGRIDAEPFASKLAADIIFRTLFSIPISHALAKETFEAFQSYQRAAPLLNISAFLPWLPAAHKRATRRAAARIRLSITKLVDQRLEAIKDGTAPDDLATGLLSRSDPETGAVLSRSEMIDQVAIFFLAGHETSASTLAWALYLLAENQDEQSRIATAIQTVDESDLGQTLGVTEISHLIKETMRLYPPVPMMVRETTRPEIFRNRSLRRATQVVISPWHLHRNPDHWENPDHFDPARFANKPKAGTFIPFSAGARVCPGAGFATLEISLALICLLKRFDIAPVAGARPCPQAHLTVRSKNGIWLDLSPRSSSQENPTKLGLDVNSVL